MFSRQFINVINVVILLMGVSYLLLSHNTALALPLPKTLIEETRLGRDTKIINFHDIKDKAPQGSKHLIVEVYTATSGQQADIVPVELVFNYGESGSYTNRVLSGEADKLATRLTESASSAKILQLPVRLEPKFGSSRAFIPWAFLKNQSKHVLSQSGVGGDFVASSMSHWDSLEAIDSISLKLKDEYKFSEGSLIQLYAVDERYLVAEQVLDIKSTGVNFPNLPQDKESLLVIGQTRSSQVNPARRGDRVWYSINGNKNNDQYRVQRITGEAPSYDVLNLNANKLLLDQINEPRVGWNTATEAPESVYGPWVVHFSEYNNKDIFKSFISLHGTRDNHYDPVGNEVGRWRGSENISSLDFFPQASNNFESGSRIGVYNTKQSDIRHVVKGRESEVVIDIPDSFDSIEWQINARSTAGVAEDDLIIEFNQDYSPANYLSQTMWALDGGGGALRGDNNDIGVIPGGKMNEKSMSDLFGSIKGLSGGESTIAHAYGGVPGSGTVKSTAVEGVESERITSVTFKTKSGNNFSPGSIFSIWVEDPYSSHTSRGDIPSGLTSRSYLLIAFLTIVALGLGIYRLRQRS